MGSVVLVTHHERPAAARLAGEAVAWLTEQGHQAEGAELAVSLGGDGTVLRAVELACPWKVPVLGVNLGRLGYLSEVEPSGLAKALERFWAGDYQIEERMTLSVSVQGAAIDRTLVALNEAVLEKSESGHTVRLALSIDGRPFLTYAADGLIVATPTGSTAYNLSARGPIVSPRLKALVLTPVSPHMLFDRVLVLEPTESTRLEVIDGRPADLVVDGRRLMTLGTGDAIECRAGDNDARFVRFASRDFYRILKTKFGLVDR
jgi:NAD+ kinase